MEVFQRKRGSANGQKEGCPFDYFFIGEMGLSNESIVGLAKRGVQEIKQYQEAKRSGPAGGDNIPSTEKEFDGKSLSPATKHRRIFIKTGGDGTQTKCVYVNPDHGNIKVFDRVYNNVLSNDLSPRAKRTEMMESPHLRERVIKEMQSRTLAMCFVSRLGWGEPEYWNEFVCAVESVCNGGSRQVARCRQGFGNVGNCDVGVGIMVARDSEPRCHTCSHGRQQEALVGNIDDAW